MDKLFDQEGLVDSNTTIGFEITAEEIYRITKETYPVFAKYFESNLKPRLHKYVFQHNRRREIEKKIWTNNNAESLDSILKLTTNWRTKSTSELIDKLYRETKIKFADYRSALHDTGNYRLASSEIKTTKKTHYLVNGTVWRCKQEEEKRELFFAFLSDKKKKQTQKYILQTMESSLCQTRQKGQRRNRMPNKG